MAWTDRIKELASYVSPNGTEIFFNYEDVSLEFDKKTSAYDFPDASGTLVQDLGHTSRRYPLRMIFTGEDHDLIADSFITAIQEVGVGLLKHPFYGSIDVVPFGRISRRDDLKTAGNQTIFEITFWETIGVIFPSAQGDPATKVSDSVNDFNVAEASEFAVRAGLDSASDRASAKNKFLALLDRARSGLQAIADTQEKVQRQFDTISNSITGGIDLLIGQPLTLAFQTSIMMQAPARALALIKAKLNAYRNLARSIFFNEDGSKSIAETNSDFQIERLYTSSFVSGSVLSAINTTFATRTEAIETAEEILSQLDEFNVWNDDNYKVFSDELGENIDADVIDTGESYQQLQESVAIVAGFLVELAFSLKQEISLTLDRKRTVIDLVAELYGEIDPQIDFFIESNDLTGDEILELPEGRLIVYYV